MKKKDEKVLFRTNTKIENHREKKKKKKRIICEEEEVVVIARKETYGFLGENTHEKSYISMNFNSNLKAWTLLRTASLKSFIYH